MELFELAKVPTLSLKDILKRNHQKKVQSLWSAELPKSKHQKRLRSAKSMEVDGHESTEIVQQHKPKRAKVEEELVEMQSEHEENKNFEGENMQDTMTSSPEERSPNLFKDVMVPFDLTTDSETWPKQIPLNDQMSISTERGSHEGSTLPVNGSAMSLYNNANFIKKTKKFYQKSLSLQVDLFGGN